MLHDRDRIRRRAGDSLLRLLGVVLGVQILAGAVGSLPAAQPDGRTDGVDCVACHAPDRLFSHPVGIAASMPVPSTLPLTRGRVACTTCHDGCDARAHAVAPRDVRYHPALRVDAPDLCNECHDGTTMAGGNPHAVALGRAHLGWVEHRGPSPSSRRPGTLDPETADCMSCHDGSLAMGAGYVTLADPALLAASRRRTALSVLAEGHPVGVEHPRAGGGSLRPAAELDRRIRLFAGRIGCGTCHSPYSRHPNLLVMSNDRSALCTSCHGH